MSSQCFQAGFNQTQSLIEAAQDTGDIFAYLIKMKIEGGDFTPNAPSTIRAKGHNRPLINTGLKDSIKSVMRGSRDVLEDRSIIRKTVNPCYGYVR